MHTVLRTLAATTVVLAMAGNATGCQPPSDTPPPAPSKAPTPVSVSFVAEVVRLGADGVTPLKKRVTLTITGIQADGAIAYIRDPNTGEKIPGPKVVTRSTPYHYDATFEPPVIGMSFRVTYLGEKGEEVICKTIKDGKQVQLSSAEVQAGPGGRGAAEAFCLYAGN